MKAPNYRQQLLHTVLAAMPNELQLIAVNIARSSASSYWLFKLINQDQVQWLTVRIATHPTWLQHAQQLQVTWSALHNFELLSRQLKTKLKPKTYQPFLYSFSVGDIAICQLLMALETVNLVWLVQLSPKLSTAHKALPLDLGRPFQQLVLCIGDRNNVNNQLTKFDAPNFQQKLAIFYGRNLLFSQFTSHYLLKLLPTNQWLKKMLVFLPKVNWQQVLKRQYGSAFLTKCQQLMRQ